MIQTVRPARRLSGTVRVPADKSIAHRAAILAAIGSDTSRLRRYPRGEDTLSTLRCLAQLGVEVSWEDDAAVIHGKGIHGLEAPKEPLDCGNSGTAMRLLAGLLAAQPFDSVLIGDDSLSRRPMERIATPLRSMGASIRLTDGHAPIHISGSPAIEPTRQTLKIASAQVKSAIILAAMQSRDRSEIIEPTVSRDHTERMLGLRINLESGVRTIEVDPIDQIDAIDVEIPGDFSSAAFFIAGATIVERSDVTLLGVGINPTRTGMLDVIDLAGATVDRIGVTTEMEPVADLHIGPGSLDPMAIGGDIVPRLIDEIPILAVLASQARGESRFVDVGELRAKETDRISAVEECLTRLDCSVSTTDDTLTVTGPSRLAGGSVESFGDHRIAMAMAIAALVAEGPLSIAGAEAASVSYPTFWDDLESLTETG